MNNTAGRLDDSADILIVEDSETQAEQLAHLLTRNGYRVQIARNGKLGIEQARAAKPTLIISDISMPEMDGFSMCSHLKKDPELKDIPVILLTALNSLYDVIKGLDCGADNFIRKPFEEKYLLGRIRFILASRALCSKERVELGMRVSLGGQTHFVTAERQQIFDLLMSTYEEAIQMTEELKAQQDQIAHSYQSIQGLYQIAATLNPAITEKEVAEKALERALDFPGVLGGCITLLDSDGSLRTVAQNGMSVQQAGTGDCAPPKSPSTEQVDDASHVSVPLKFGERTLGVMNLLYDTDSSRSQEDSQVLETVGNQIAIALERANLYANMESLVNERTEALRTEKNLLSAVVNTTGALVFLADPSGKIVMFNPAAERALGWKLGEVRNRPFWEVFLPRESAAAMEQFFDSTVFTKGPPHIDGECITREGELKRIIWSTTYLRSSNQTVEYVLGTGLDVTELHVAQEKVQYLSNFDALTDLPNRILLRDGMRLLQQRVLANKNVLGFLMIDFARMPFIRESLGGKAEQMLLRQIAGRLREWGKDVDRVGRLGDSSFAVMAVRQEPHALSVVARQILALLDEPFIFDEQEVHLEPCVGISIFQTDGQEFDSLVQCAEVALRRAMASKSARYVFSTAELNRGANERFRLENALRNALSREELVLHYQPQVDLHSGRMIGMEALIRWQHPELGMVPPSRFIGLAEETGLIVPIGEWVLRTACAQARAWQCAGFGNLRIGVNLSARQFLQQDLVALIGSVLEETQLEPSLLDIEITESMVMTDVEQAISILSSLRALGVQISIDDFGTGYSSLAYVKRFPIDVLKIDQSFVREIPAQSSDAAIADAIISLAHSLGIKVIAEGVETEAQCEFLARRMCDEFQGYLFSKPLPASELEALLQKSQLLPSHLRRSSHGSKAVLLVKQDPASMAALTQAAEHGGYTVQMAQDARQALWVLSHTRADIIVCNQALSDGTALDFLREVRRLCPNAVGIVITDVANSLPVTQDIEHEAVFRIVARPVDASQLRQHIDDAIAHVESVKEKLRLQEEVRLARLEIAKLRRQMEERPAARLRRG